MMPRFNVNVPIAGYVNMSVEADDEASAMVIQKDER
jgi:hypothetical protein